jgi:small subunit ribosomal protein S4
MGLSATRTDARQLVRHKHIQVNGKSVNIPSYLIKTGDKITLREASKGLKRVQLSLETAGRREHPEWLDFDKSSLSGTVRSLPARESVTLPIQEQLIVEFYSR